MNFVRRHLTYANVAATVALVFSMSGGALAAKHYLINSVKQIDPKVLNALRGHNGNSGSTGPAGPPGLAGPQGTAGTQGARGDTGASGPAGPSGATGATGPTGEKGSNGATNAVIRYRRINDRNRKPRVRPGGLPAWRASHRRRRPVVLRTPDRCLVFRSGRHSCPAKRGRDANRLVRRVVQRIGGSRHNSRLRGLRLAVTRSRTENVRARRRLAVRERFHSRSSLCCEPSSVSSRASHWSTYSYVSARSLATSAG